MVGLWRGCSQFKINTRKKHVFIGSITAFFAISIFATGAVVSMRGIDSFAATACNPDATNINDAICMQDMNDEVMTSMVVGAQYQLKDSRDDKMYWISRLQDGHVWMTQNLDLNLSTSSVLTSNDTDLNDGSLSGAYADGYTVNNGVISWTPVRSTLYATGTTIPGWVLDHNTPYSLDVGERYCIDGNCTNVPAEDGDTHKHVGNYYNWPAAIASNDASSLTVNTHDNINNNPKNSICPAGWRLPTASSASGSEEGSTAEFKRLIYLYDDLESSSGGLFFVRSGYVAYGGVLEGEGTFGYYESSTFFSSEISDGFAIEPYRDPFESLHNRNTGKSMRCVSRANIIINELSFDTNGGSDDAPDTQTCEGSSCQITIPNITPVRNGYRFLGWAESSGATSATYQPGDEITLSSDKTLYAVWKRVYTITFIDTLTDEVARVWTCETDNDGDACYITDRAPFVRHEGYEYRDVSNESGSIVHSPYYSNWSFYGDEIYYLNYIESRNYKVSFDANGGSNAPETQMCYLNGDTSCNVIIPSDEPTYSGRIFYGWGETPDATSATYQPGDEIVLSSNKTLYAIWIPKNTLRYNLKYGSFVGILGDCYPDIPGGTCDVRVIDEKPSRSGYSFLGWSTTSNTNNIDYNPGDTVTLSSDQTLYAIWKKESSDHGDLDGCNNQALNIENAICLQDMNNLVKYTMQTNTEYELIDARDGITYRVARLADNNVWLLDNLQIGSEEEMLLTLNDTNTNPNLNNGEFILPASGDWVNSYTEPAIDTAEADRMLGNDADKVEGGHYNYCAASAGTYCDEADEAESDAEYDICPAGWRMPTGGNSGEYQTVNNLYDDLINVLHLPLSGRFYGGSLGQIDQNGYFWSSTNRDGMRMYYLNRSNQTIDPTGSYRRDRGYSMRCILNIREEGSSEYRWKDDINEHAIGDKNDLTLIVDLPLRALISVKIDNQVLNEEDYKLSNEEGTNIILITQYLDKLGLGKHQITATYVSGASVMAEFVINEEEIIVPDTDGAEDEIKIPNTGSSTKNEDGQILSERLAISILIGVIVTVSSGVLALKRLNKK